MNICYVFKLFKKDFIYYKMIQSLPKEVFIIMEMD